MMFRCESRGGVQRFARTLALLVCMQATQAAEPACAQVIRGVVVDSVSQRPVTGVLVVVTDSAGRDVQRAMVDDNGEFEFLARVPGWYGVRAERWGMSTKAHGRIDVAADDTVSLRLALVQLPLDRLVEEVGRIVDLADREPPPESGVAGASAGEPGFAYTEGGGVIVGQVREADDVRREVGGRVGLVAVGLAVEVDWEGRFVIPGLPEGTYPLTYLRPSLDGLDWNYSLADAVVRLGDTTAVTLQPAHPHQVLAWACGLDQWKPYTGVLEGQVLLPVSGLAAQGIRVVAEWFESGAINPRAVDGMVMTAVAETNVMGTFRICGIPTDRTTVEVTAGERTTRVSTTTIMSDAKPVVKMTLWLPRRPGSVGAIPRVVPAVPRSPPTVLLRPPRPSPEQTVASPASCAGRLRCAAPSPRRSTRR